MLLAGDIGGTKTVLALVEAGAGPAPKARATFESDRYPGLEDVVREYLDSTGAVVDTAVFGVAGPVVQGRVVATNLPWIVSEESLRRRLGLREIHLLNDLEATAYGVLHLGAGDLFVLNDVPARSGTRAVIAPGTGLGEAVLFQGGGRYYAIPSEGGHTDFGPTNPLEMELLRYLMARFDHVSYERICSGMGLPNLYAFLRDSGHAPESQEMADALRQAEDPTPVIVQKALAGASELASATLHAFVSILGAEAGNLALKVLPVGGLYVGGGIPPRILPRLRDGTFMAAFVNKGRFAGLMAQIPVYVILNPRTALLGAAAYGLGLL